MVKNSAASLLTSVDDLFTTQEERDEAKRETIMEIPLSQISDFPNHPFKVKMDESMSDLVESVKSYGVLSPVIVRPKGNEEYEMIAGHRRKRANELAGKDSIKCIVQDVTDDEAIILMVDSNLQREQLLPSEKAFAYKMKLDAMKRQGFRSDLTSATLFKEVDTLLVHCYGGQSRSRAVGAFAVKMLGGDNSKYFTTGNPNQHVYDVLETAWLRHRLMNL